MVGTPPFSCDPVAARRRWKNTPNSVPAKSRPGSTVIFHHGVDRAARRQAVGFRVARDDRGPGGAAVGALQQVGGLKSPRLWLLKAA